MSWSINLPKVCGSRDQAWLRFCLTIRKMTLTINLPKVCGLRSQAWLRFYLIFEQVVERVTYNVINQNMVKNSFINNNTFSGCLHSKGVVQRFPLDLQDHMHLFQPLKWCDMAFPNSPSLLLGVKKLVLSVRNPISRGITVSAL